MKFKLLSLLCVVSLALFVACSGGASGDASVATTFKIDSVISSGSTNNIESDMLSPEGITADYANITVSNLQKNPNATPSHLNNVTIYKYEVSFRRTDGGIVFETFEKNLSQTVQVNSTLSFSALIVRLEEKTSGVLAGQSLPIQMEADIKIFGRTGSGDEVVTTGGIAVTIADYNGEQPPAAAISSFYAVNSSINPGDTVTLAWYATGSVYEFVLNPGDQHLSVNEYYPYGTIDIPNVNPPQTFTLHALGMFGSDSSTVDVTLKAGGAGPTINYFGANPETIASGASSILEWNVTGADSVVIYPEIGSVALGSGTISVSPAVTTTYTILTKNSGGTSSDTTTVEVQNSDPVIGLFAAGASEVSYNNVVHLYWNVYGSYDKLELFPYYDGSTDILDVTNMSSVVSKAITTDTTFVLSAFGPNKIINSSVSVTVATAKAPSIQSFTKLDSKVIFDVEKYNDSKTNYKLFTAFGDNLVLDNSKGSLMENGKIESNYSSNQNNYGYSVLGNILTDDNGNVSCDYRFISNHIGENLIETINLDSTGDNYVVNIELSKSTNLFIKQIAGNENMTMMIDGKVIDGKIGANFNNADAFTRINFTREYKDSKLLIVAKDVNGFVNGRIITIGK